MRLWLLVLLSLLFGLSLPLLAQTPSNISNGGVQVTCTTTTGILLAAQATPSNRVAARISMDSGSTTRVCPAATCTTTTGEQWVAGQALFDAPATYGGAYSCITATGTSTFSVIEILRVAR